MTPEPRGRNMRQEVGQPIHRTTHSLQSIREVADGPDQPQKAASCRGPPISAYFCPVSKRTAKIRRARQPSSIHTKKPPTQSYESSENSRLTPSPGLALKKGASKSLGTAGPAACQALYLVMHKQETHVVCASWAVHARIVCFN